MTHKQFYKSVAWQRARSAYIAQRIATDGGICEVCGKDMGMIVHHKVWLTDSNVSDPEISLSPRNFRFECQTCHNREKDPAKGAQGQSRCTYGPDGEIIRSSEY